MGFNFETQNLILRTLTMNDVESYFNIVQDDDIRFYVPGAYIESIEETRFFFKMCYTQPDLKNDFYIGIEEKKSNKLIGVIIVTKNTYDKFEGSYFIDKSFRGKGYMKEALQCFLKNISFSGSIIFEVKITNFASLAIIEKIEGIQEKTNHTISKWQWRTFYYH